MKKLERRLGLSAVIAISISSMVGSGIFVLPGIAVTLTGPSLWLAYLASALCVLPAALSKAELATAMPTSGGTYVYIERTFGPFAGTVAGLGLWLSLLLKASFALMGFGAYLGVFTNLPITNVSLSLLAVIVLLNILGVGKVSWTMMLIVGTCILTLFALNLAAIPSFDTALLEPHFLEGMDGFVAATAMVFVSYAGVTKIAAIAEEIKDPIKNMPKGILFSLFIVTLIYSSVTFMLSATVPFDQLSGNLKPIYTMAKAITGPYVSSIIAIVAILTMTSMANAGILAASRFPFAMARDNLLPKFLGTLNQKYLTPVMSIILSGIVVCTSLLTLDVTKMAKLASAFMIMVYLIENLTLIILRESRVQWYKPGYKTKFYPFIQILGIVSGVGLLIPMGPIFVKGILSIGIPGLLIYLFYGKHQTNRKGVLGMRKKRADLLDVGDDSSLKQEAAHSIMEDMDLTRDASVIVAIFGKERSPESLVEKGISLTESGSVEVGHITEVPEQTDLKDLAQEQPKLRSLRRRILAMALEKRLPITFDPIVTHDLSKTVLDMSVRMHCKWLLVEWGGKSRGTFTIHNPVGWLKSHLHSHLGVFRDAGVRYVRKIMVYLKPGQNEEFLLNTADHLALTHKADITIVALKNEQFNDKDEQKLHSHIQDKAKACKSVTSINIIEKGVKLSNLIEHSFKFDLLVFEASEHNYLNDLMGSEDDKLIAQAACSVLCVQKSKYEIENPFE